MLPLIEAAPRPPVSEISTPMNEPPAVNFEQGEQEHDVQNDLDRYREQWLAQLPKFEQYKE